jgi:hypothetical protein
MSEKYSGAQTGLTVENIADLRALYGPRPNDAFDAVASNDSSATATSLATGSSVEADLTTAKDVDVYSFRATTTQPLTISLGTAGKSLLVARVSVYDANQQLLASTSAVDPTSGNLQVTLPTIAGENYFVRVEAADADFAVGGYRLNVGQLKNDLGSQSEELLATETRVDTRSLAASLPLNSRGNGYLTSSLAAAQDVDVYSLQVPRNSNGRFVLTVSAWALGTSAVNPIVTLSDAGGKQIATNVLKNDSAGWTLEIDRVKPGQQLFVTVTHEPGSAGQSGDYALAVNVREGGEKIKSQASGTLTPKKNIDFVTLKITEKSLFHFELAGTMSGNGGSSNVQLALFDSANRLVFATSSGTGLTVSQDVWLGAGVYTVRIAAFSANGDFANVRYTLDGYSRSDSVGLGLIDPTLTPIGTKTTPTVEPIHTFFDPKPTTFSTSLLIIDDYYTGTWGR